VRHDAAPNPTRSAPLLDEGRGRGRRAWRRAGLATAGIVLVVLGLVGWILPVVPGVPALLVGLTLVGGVSPRVGRRLGACEARLPVFVRRLLGRGVGGSHPGRAR